MTEQVQITENHLTVEVTEAPPQVVEIEETSGTTVTVELPSSVETLEVSIPGPAGPTGPQGPVGTDLHYTHTQSVPSSVWEYEHGLGKHPSVRTFGTDGVEILGDVTYPDLDSARVEFGGTMSGVAYNN